LRLYREQEHNRRIAGKAEIIWGEATLAGRQRIKRRSDLIIKACGIVPGMRVLEIGCGTGRYSSMFAQTKAQLFATDISWELMTHAAKQNDGQNILCQAERLPFKDMSFDAVVGNAVLHHLDLSLALQEIKRVLTHKGRFAFTEPNMLNPQNMLIKNVKFLGHLFGESPDETAFFSWKILKQLRKAGFCEPMAQPFDFLHPIVPDSMVGIVNLLGGFMERIYGVRNMAGSLIISGGKGKEVIGE